MHITIFGPGCARCTEAEHLVRDVVAAAGGCITVQKVSGFKEMMAAGVLSTPAIAVDGIVKAMGRVPGKEEIAGWIDAAAGAGEDGEEPRRAVREGA